jgi:hypothetical protein
MIDDPNTDSYRAGDLTFIFNEKATKCLRFMRAYTAITLADMNARQALELLEFLKQHAPTLKEAVKNAHEHNTTQEISDEH